MRFSIHILFAKQQQLRGHEILNRLSTLSIVAIEQYYLVKL